ncbi:unnamed protein product, partial [Urochloa humidicola]
MASSGPNMDLDLLHMRKVNAPVPPGIYVPMCFSGDNCKLVQCQVLGVYYGMRFFMCDNYEYDPIKSFSNVRPKWLDTEKTAADKAHVVQEVRWAR